MPMTRRQLHQTEIDYQDFLPRHGHVVSVREGGGQNAPCAICGGDGVGKEKKVIGFVAPEGSLGGRWTLAGKVVCRIGKACRGRAYDKQVARKVQRRRTP